MTDNHPIIPPPELVQQWDEECDSGYNPEIDNTFDALKCFASKAAQWGADQELEACISAILSHPGFEQPELFVEVLRAARRPKPPNKKQRGLTALEATNLKEDDPLLYQEILNAIEGLPND